MQTINLQGIGKMMAVPASNIKPGVVLMWNYGYTSTVLAILSETSKSMVIKTKSEGGVFTRRLMKTRLVAIHWRDPLLTFTRQ